MISLVFRNLIVNIWWHFFEISLTTVRSCSTTDLRPGIELPGDYVHLNIESRRNVNDRLSAAQQGIEVTWDDHKIAFQIHFISPYRYAIGYSIVL